MRRPASPTLDIPGVGMCMTFMCGLRIGTGRLIPDPLPFDVPVRAAGRRWLEVVVPDVLDAGLDVRVPEVLDLAVVDVLDPEVRDVLEREVPDVLEPDVPDAVPEVRAPDVPVRDLDVPVRALDAPVRVLAVPDVLDPDVPVVRARDNAKLPKPTNQTTKDQQLDAPDVVLDVLADVLEPEALEPE